MEPIHEEIFALLFGASIVALFSYERFNRNSFGTGTRLERLVSVLSPEKLRARKVIRRVWGYYCIGLLALYLTLCVYSDVLGSIIGLEGDSAPAGATGEKVKSIGIPPSVSLAIALILTGLAPSVPVLKRFEEWGRVTAHRIAGIPTRVLSDTDVLRRQVIDLAKRDPQDSLMIPSGDWERRSYYRDATLGQVTDPDDFTRDIDVIISVSAWILERRLQLQNAELRESFEEVEDELRRRKDLLFLQLDERTGFSLGGQALSGFAEAGASVDPVQTAPINELKRKSWDRVASEVDNLAEDMCILLALFVEHGLVPKRELHLVDTPHAAHEATKSGGDYATDNGNADLPKSKSLRQHDLSAWKLSQFLNGIWDDTAPEDQRSFAMRAFFWSAAIILVVTIMWSFGPGQYEIGLRDGREYVPFGERTSRFIIIAINGLVLPVAVFLLLRDSAKQALRWNNLWRSHWTVWLPQTAAGLLLSWLFCVLLIIAVSLWMSALKGQLNELITWNNVSAVLQREYLVVLRGCLLGLIVVLLLDGRAAHIPSLDRSPTWKSSLQWGLISSCATAAMGALARLAQSLAFARQWGEELEAIDMGLIFYSTLYSAIVGFCVVFFLSEVLLNQKPNRRRGEAQFATKPAE